MYNNLPCSLREKTLSSGSEAARANSPIDASFVVLSRIFLLRFLRHRYFLHFIDELCRLSPVLPQIDFSSI